MIKNKILKRIGMNIIMGFWIKSKMVYIIRKKQGKLQKKMVKKLIKKTASILQLQKDKFTYF